METNNTKTFKKGQPVTFLQTWSWTTGEVKIVELIVYSCGKKQMVLVDEKGEKFQGTHFAPQVEQGRPGRVLPRLSKAEAEAAALEWSAQLIKAEIEHINRCLIHYATAGEGYLTCMRAKLARALTLVPSFQWKEKA
jgi:hypothetical protein